MNEAEPKGQIDAEDAYKMRHGLAPYETDHTFQEIADKYEVTRSAAKQRLDKYEADLKAEEEAERAAAENPPPESSIEEQEPELEPNIKFYCQDCGKKLKYVTVEGKRAGPLYCDPDDGGCGALWNPLPGGE